MNKDKSEQQSQQECLDCKVCGLKITHSVDQCRDSESAKDRGFTVYNAWGYEPIKKQQSQQGIVEVHNLSWHNHTTSCSLATCNGIESRDCVLGELLRSQAQETRKETLEEVVEKFGRYNDGCGCCMDQKLEELIQSLINNQ